MMNQPKHSFVACVLVLTAAFTLCNANPAGAQLPPDQGPGGPILVVTSAGNAFTKYYAEILRAEGLNAFAVADIGSVTAGALAGYDVVILGEMPLSAGQVTMFTNWVDAGGNLIAMRPSKQLYGLLGLTDQAATISNAYLLVNAAGGPGAGIVNQTIQFHHILDRASLTPASGASIVASLYSDATTATANPAVTLRNVGQNGGQAAAFLFDLARSVVYTRQGNPAWAGQARDGRPTIRSHDLFYGAAAFDPQPDWVDLNKVAIPQADEQQRLLANLILNMNADKKPLPRFWYFPRGKKAVIVMTGDDHGNGGTAGRFDQYKAFSAPGCSVIDWECIRSTSYIYSNTPLTDAQAAAYTLDGFEVGVHVEINGCSNWTSFADLDGRYSSQIATWKAKYASIPAPTTHRTHCVVWSDWATQPKVELTRGIGLDTNYYYWPADWLQNRPGLFTGSGLPMRFADVDGSMIDVYQAVSQINDENSQTYPFTIDSLLDKALGPEGYYGAFTANVHTDFNDPAGSMGMSNTIIASAQARSVPVVSARQMLNWLDGRNDSSFGSIGWNNATSTLSFTVTVGAGGNGLQAMIPYRRGSAVLGGVTGNGIPVAFAVETIKGIEYAVFAAAAGQYQAGYLADATSPVISLLTARATGPSTAVISWDTDEVADARVSYGISPAALTLTATDVALVIHHTLTLTALSPNTTYHYRVVSSDSAGNASTSPTPPATLTFTTPQPSFIDTTVADFSTGTLSNTSVTNAVNGEVALAPSASEEFSGSTLPVGWSSATNSQGGTAVVGAGTLTLDGARAATNTSYGPGRSLEFMATLGAGPFQHIGFAADLDFNSPWAIFSTFDTSSALYARTSDGTNTPIPGNWLNGPHRYRIDWNSTSVVFWIDGAQVASHPVTIATNMRLAASDYNVSGANLSIDWMQIIPPYQSSGSFDSRIFDAGATTNWGTLSWSSQLPGGTNLAMSIRTGATAIPDGTWTAFTAIPASGGAISGSSRYIQYRAALATADPASTPVLQDVTIGYSTASTPPVAANDAFSVNEDTGLTVAVPGVLANDSDPQGHPLTAIIVNNPANAAVFSFNPNGSFTYTPNLNFNGTDSFTYKVNNGNSESSVATVSITVNPVNDAPGFTKGTNLTVLEDAPGQTVNGWATALSPGPPDESGQTLVNFIVSNNNTALFSVQPSVGINGTLIYTPAPNANGVATVTVQLRDNGGTANGGADTSAPQTFTISVTAVNDAPSFTKGANQTTIEDAGSQSITGWATNLNAGPPNEATQTLSFIVSNTNPTLFSTQPAVAANGTLTYTPALNANGAATVSVQVRDNGGTTNGGVDTSAIQTFTVTVTAVNDAPAPAPDSKSTSQNIPITFPATDLSANDSVGPANENGQTLTVTAVNGTASTHGTVALFGGNVTYTPDLLFSGSASFQYTVCDNGTTNGAADPKCSVGIVNVIVSPLIGQVRPNESSGANETQTLTLLDVVDAAVKRDA